MKLREVTLNAIQACKESKDAHVKVALPARSLQLCEHVVKVNIKYMKIRTQERRDLMTYNHTTALSILYSLMYT